MPSVAEKVAYINGLMGRPWDKERLNCWDVVRLIQRDLYGRPLPSSDPALADDAWALSIEFATNPERARWTQVQEPKDGAVVLMSRSALHSRDTHAGVYLDLDGGGVAHSNAPHGVVFDGLLELQALRRWNRVAFYLPVIE